MAFTSFRFIVFLVLAAAAYFLTPKRCRWVTLFVANICILFYFRWADFYLSVGDHGDYISGNGENRGYGGKKQDCL